MFVNIQIQGRNGNQTQDLRCHNRFYVQYKRVFKPKKLASQETPKFIKIVACVYTNLSWQGDSEEGLFGLRIKLPPAHLSTTVEASHCPFLLLIKLYQNQMLPKKDLTFSRSSSPSAILRLFSFASWLLMRVSSTYIELSFTIRKGFGLSMSSLLKNKYCNCLTQKGSCHSYLQIRD